MFKIPVIPPDLRHEETITQAAHALDCLHRTISAIFCQIDKRIERNNVKVKELQERIKRSEEKINSLRGTRKAIHIYAPARYPATNIFKDIPATFYLNVPAKYKENIEFLKVCHIQSKLEANLPNANEKLIFFHVRNNTVEVTDKCVPKEFCNIQQKQNLGNMPSDLRSIPSILLFNTEYSVYLTDEYDGKVDAWKCAKTFKNKRQQQSHNDHSVIKQLLEPAPHSLANRHNEKLTPSGTLKYTPKHSQAPELDLPLDLPDLPGIADDLRYESQEAKQKIAPSMALAVENLPELTELMEDSVTNIIKNEADLETTNAIIPLPPPPLPTEAKRSNSIPAPPPPPPPSFQMQSPQTTPNNNTSSLLAPPSSDKRSELMAAIRNAGGVGKAHLRRTAAAPLAKNKDNIDNNQHNKQTSCSPHSGDLMADLHNKLLMRRKGISGSKDTTESTNKITINNNVTSAPSGNPVISRLSSLIPPPPTTNKSRTQSNATTSEDEDDSNDTDWVD